MKPSVAIILVAALVSACASPSTMRTRTADGSFTSSRPAREVAACVATGWEDSSPLGTVNVQMRISERGFIVAVVNPFLQFSHVMVDVDEAPAGSTTKYFKQAPDPWPQFDLPVERCQRAP